MPRPPYVLLFGAGFSKWAVDLPLSSQLFDWKISNLSEPEDRRLERLQSDKALWDRENPDTSSEVFIAYAEQKGIQTRARVLWYITRRLSEPFLVDRNWNQAFMIDERSRMTIPGIVQAKMFLDAVQFQELAGIITTNYDLLPEYALGTLGFNYGRIGEQLSDLPGKSGTS